MTGTRLVFTHIKDLYSFLCKTDVDRVILRTSFVDGNWYQNESAAHSAGFNIYRSIAADACENHEFPEVYILERRSKNEGHYKT